MRYNPLCRALNIEKPIIQGPMAWVATPPLVAAVSNAGGLGVLGVGFAPPEIITSQIQETKKLTDKPFGINVVLFPQILETVTSIVAQEKPDIIYADTLEGFDLDLCTKYFTKWKNLGLKVIVKVGTIQDAITAEKGGADAVIVKGWEGGGHVSYESTFVLVPQAADVLTIPFVASGGIADGRGMAAAIALGADGIEMGTAFMCATEGTIHENAMQAIINAGDMENVVTGMPTGEPCRQIKNKLSEKLLAIEAENTSSAAAEMITAVAASSLKNAMLDGDVENEGAVMAGQIAPLITSIRPVAEIIDTTITQCKNVFEKMNKFAL